MKTTFSPSLMMAIFVFGEMEFSSVRKLLQAIQTKRSFDVKDKARRSIPTSAFQNEARTMPPSPTMEDPLQIWQLVRNGVRPPKHAANPKSQNDVDVLKTNRFIILRDDHDAQGASTSKLESSRIKDNNSVSPPKREEMSKAELKNRRRRERKAAARVAQKNSNPGKFNGFSTGMLHEFTSCECNYRASIEAMRQVSRDDQRKPSDTKKQAGHQSNPVCLRHLGDS
jgi:hypothetical protein